MAGVKATKTFHPPNVVIEPDCSLCRNFRGPAKWPDTEQVCQCALHSVSLAVQIGADGYRQGIWFCKEFESKRPQSRKAHTRFDKLQSQLEPHMLYTLAGVNRYLIEHRVADLERAKPVA